LSLQDFLTATDEKIKFKHLQEESVENYRKRFFGSTADRADSRCRGFVKQKSSSDKSDEL
jgi:hypothetical protein